MQKSNIDFCVDKISVLTRVFEGVGNRIGAQKRGSKKMHGTSLGCWPNS